MIAKGYRLTSQNPGEGHSASKGMNADADLETVLQYENPDVVDRISFELDLPHDKASDLFEDLKKYLWMASRSEGPTIPAPQIDKAWHEFLMFTQDYQQFCGQMFGSGTFLHHVPHKGKNDIGEEAVYPTIDMVLATFKAKPSPNWDYIM